MVDLTNHIALMGDPVKSSSSMQNELNVGCMILAKNVSILDLSQGCIQELTEWALKAR